MNRRRRAGRDPEDEPQTGRRAGGRRERGRRSGGGGGGSRNAVLAIVGVGLAVAIVLTMVFAFGGEEKDDRGKPDQGGGTAGLTTDPKPETGGGGLFDAASAEAAAESRPDDEPVRVVGREPKTIDLVDLVEHEGRLHSGPDLDARIKALREEVERYRRERWDVTREMVSTYEELKSEARERKRDPFLSEVSFALSQLNTTLEKSELHKSGADGELLPKPFVGFVDKPYAIYVQATPEGDEQEIAERVMGELKQLKQAFIDYFGGFIDLETKKKKAIKVLLLRTHKEYETYNRIRSPERDIIGALAHYQPWDGLLVVPLTYGDEGDGDPDQKLREVMFHEGTHQLLDYHTGQNHLSAFGAMWSDEGVAEYFGGHVMKDDGTIVFGRVNSRIASLEGEFAKRLRAPLIEVLKFTRYTQKKLRDEKKQFEAMRLTQGVYAQGWAMVYFMNNYRNGLYKKQFQEIMRRQIEKGDAGVVVFKQAFDLDEGEYEKFEREFEAYLDYLATVRAEGRVRDGVILDPEA